jgi:hypothetical protein
VTSGRRRRKRRQFYGNNLLLVSYPRSIGRRERERERERERRRRRKISEETSRIGWDHKWIFGVAVKKDFVLRRVSFAAMASSSTSELILVALQRLLLALQILLLTSSSNQGKKGRRGRKERKKERAKERKTQNSSVLFLQGCFRVNDHHAQRQLSDQYTPETVGRRQLIINHFDCNIIWQH